MNYTAAAYAQRHCSAKYGTARVFGVIAAHVGLDSEDRTCWPSIERMAELAELSPRTVQRAIKALAETDQLDVACQQGPSGPNGPTNLYTVAERFSWSKIVSAIRSERSVDPEAIPRDDILSPEVSFKGVETCSLENVPMFEDSKTWDDNLSPHAQDGETTAKRRRRGRPTPTGKQMTEEPKNAEPDWQECGYCGKRERSHNGYCSSDCALADFGVASSIAKVERRRRADQPRRSKPKHGDPAPVQRESLRESMDRKRRELHELAEAA